MTDKVVLAIDIHGHKGHIQNWHESNFREHNGYCIYNSVPVIGFFCISTFAHKITITRAVCQLMTSYRLYTTTLFSIDLRCKLQTTAGQEIYTSRIRNSILIFKLVVMNTTKIDYFFHTRTSRLSADHFSFVDYSISRLSVDKPTSAQMLITGIDIKIDISWIESEHKAHQLYHKPSFAENRKIKLTYELHVRKVEKVLRAAYLMKSLHEKQLAVQFGNIHNGFAEHSPDCAHVLQLYWLSLMYLLAHSTTIHIVFI